MVRATDPYQPVPAAEEAHSGMSTVPLSHQDHPQSSASPPHLSAYDAQQQQYPHPSNAGSGAGDIELNAGLHPRRSLSHADPHDLPPSIHDEAGPPAYTVEQQLQQLAKTQDAAAEKKRDTKTFLLMLLNSAILIAVLGIAIAMFVEGRNFRTKTMWPASGYTYTSYGSDSLRGELYRISSAVAQNPYATSSLNSQVRSMATQLASIQSMVARISYSQAAAASPTTSR